MPFRRAFADNKKALAILQSFNLEDTSK